MNLLEHYIDKIYSEEEQEYKGVSLVKVDIDIDCYGRKERKTEYFPPDSWTAIKKKGYYMA